MVGLILLASFLIKSIYIFTQTTPSDYLFNDMATYWQNAMIFSEPGIPPFSTLALFPPFYSFFLSTLLRLTPSTVLITHGLEIGIVFQLSLSTLSVYALYHLTLQVTKNRNASLLVCFLYAFSPLVLYLNALILAENLSTPLLLISCTLFLKEEKTPVKKFFNLAVSGILLGGAVAAKPGFIFLFIAFLIHLLAAPKKSWRVRALGVLIFSLCLSLAPFFTVLKNYQMSEGKMLGLGANGGLNFFQGACKYYKVTSDSEMGYYWASSPALLSKPGLGEFKTNIPYYNQSHYYKLGLECLTRTPFTWLEKAADMINLYTGPFGPGPSDRKEFTSLLEISRWALMMASSVLILLPWALSSLETPRKHYAEFLIQILFLYLTTIAIFTLPERRYLAAVEPFLYLLAALTLRHFTKNRPLGRIFR